MKQPSQNSIIIHEASTNKWLHFKKPCKVIEVYKIEDVLPKLSLVESLVGEKKLYAAGFLSYEASPAFDSALTVHSSSDFPLLWFCLYEEPEIITLDFPESEWQSNIEQWVPTVNQKEYNQIIDKIKRSLEYGETYQVNYTFRLRTPFSNRSWPVFLNLVLRQKAKYCAYIETDRFSICSVSPELFFNLNGNTLIAQPMKGTSNRAFTQDQDKAIAQQLQYSEKNRAENVMIVDMIRNDIGRIAKYGTVNVVRLFDVEKYPTVWQMTSTITGNTDASVSDILSAMFPCASVTGAPKPNTMKIISQLEATPRRIYTGTIGFFTPERKAQFNVAIRTLLIDKQKKEAEYGVGGGIVWDSIAGNEYEECRIKANVLIKKIPQFSLLESILWTPSKKYFLIDYHLERLNNSAEYFSIPIDINRIHKSLIKLSDAFLKDDYKIRLLVSQDGTFSFEKYIIKRENWPRPVRLKLAIEHIDSQNVYLYHKTTNRQIYNKAKADCPDYDDVVLWNERNEITETSIANIVVEYDNRLITPPVKCGLLPGTFRAWLIEQKKIEEKVIPIEIFKKSNRIYTVNSVREWCEACFF
jgi:para-aminobenzoate synthetase/4-amino-4-deoxychorismate lyase